MKIDRREFLALALAGAMAGPAASQDSVRIASVDSLSGVTSSLGQDVSRGLQLAVEQINAAGGIEALGGARIEFVEYDTQSKVEVAQAQAEKAIAEGAVALIGNSASAAALATTTVAERAGVPIVVSGASAGEITKRGYQFTFKINPNPESSYGTTRAELSHFFGGDTRLETLVHVHEDGAFGAAVNNGIYKNLAGDLGFELVEMAFKSGSADMSGLISHLRRTDGQALVFTGYVPDAITFTNAAKQARVSFPFFDVGISIGDANYRQSVPEANRELLFGYQYFNPNVRPEGNEDGPAEFDAAFREKFGDAPGFISANAWTSMMVLKEAYEMAGSTEAEAVRDALRQVEFTPEKGHIMANPSVKFDETGQNVNANILKVQQIDGTLEVVYPPDYATADFRLAE